MEGGSPVNTVKTRPLAAAVPSASAATLAKGALRRLALQQLQPTPQNYARAYAEEATANGSVRGPNAADGVAAGAVNPVAILAETSAADGPARPTGGTDTGALQAQGAAWAGLLERMAKNLERGGRQWTAARRRQSLQHVLSGSRSDAFKLQQRLGALMSAWETDVLADDDLGSTELAEVASPADPAHKSAATSVAGPPTVCAWLPLLEQLQTTVRVGLTPTEPLSVALSQSLLDCVQSIASPGATAQQQEQLAVLCQQARAMFGQRHRLVQQLTALSHELCASMVDLAEEGSWARGHCEVVQACLQGEASQRTGLEARETDSHGLEPVGLARAANAAPTAELSVRAVKAASQALQHTRLQQERLRGERQAARDALKQLIHGMLLEVNELGDHTGRFESATAAHAEAISKADSLQDLTGVIKSMLADSQAVQLAVSRSQARLQADRDHATLLEERVLSLESELQRLSTEVSTDALTQVANRRGLAQAFATETARCQRQPDARLALGLIDIDNFKKLNDSLGHAAGDVALKTLAAEVKTRLRPVDHLARFGGEEFVVVLPDTALDEAQQALTRLQRSLTEALFLHEGREVFVTFSAGVTLWLPGETMESALERADGALYVAKRTGKNRTCSA